MTPNIKYDVFISFRGEDTRNNFTSHLEKALSDKSLQVYIDKRLERGEEISSALLKAIEESKLSIVVFSKNYASSRWCLDELVHILKCKERDGQIVVPIFYHVTPSDVRKQVGSFGDAFRELEERFKRNVAELSGLTRVMKTALTSIKGYFNGAHEECFRSSESDKLTKWRTALTSIADLSGWPTPLRTMYMGTSTIEGLSLYTRDIKHDIDIKPSTFNEMYNLRLLKIIVCMGNYKLRVSKGLDFLPDALRYLKWVQYPLKSLPSTFIPHNLVKLDMPLGEFEHLWNGLQHVDSLKYVKLCFSKKLYNAPNLSRANLKSADFEGCTSLVEAPSMRFQQLETNNNKVIMNQITSKVWSQREDLLRYGSSMGIEIHENSLNLSGCSNLKTLSHLSGNIEYIYLRSTAIEVLHHSIWCLGHLSLLDLNNCRSLKNLPKDMICKLECLKELNLGGCVCINMFPKLPKNIVKVDLSGTSIEQVPSSSFDYCFYSLEVLSMKNCTQLGSITTSLSKLKMLNYLDISYCSKLKCFPHITEPQVHLAQLYLDGSGIEEIHWSIKKLIGLRKLDLRRCKNLKSLPIGIFCMNHFEYLYLPERSEMGSSSFLRFEYQYYRDAYDIAKKSISNPFQITNYSEKGYIHPVDQIPFCIPNQSEGSSMDFKFSSTQLDETISITLALCIVVEFVELRTHDEMMNHIIRCESHFIKHDNTTRKCVFVFPKQANHAICFDSKKYLFVWYVNEMCSYIHDTVKISFDFSIIDVKGKQHQVGKIKRCGIHVYDNNEKIYHNYFPLLLFISKERNGNHFDMSNRKGMTSPSDIITIARQDRLGNEEPF
ncbi:hypothetical protein G4B88_031033 [Cannabis sativa]|uniref:TIR domain-containing protein n=1 Tax=Cannabis sativa TaxID=3483 RepID=A0A7J6FYH6_CANSA|nr:hypothetical protein G4B88_031033 [Cannabis sativa]